MMKKILELLGLSMGLTLLISVFSAISVAMNWGDNGIISFQIGAFACAAVLLFFYMRRREPTLKPFGFKKPQVSVSKALVVYIALVVMVQPVILGADFSLPVSTYLLILLQMALVGWVEETLFRGIFFYFLKERQPKVYLLFSSIVFGVLHVASGLNPETAPMLVVLQIINALLLGAVFAVLYYSLRSLYVVMTFHALFNLFASVTVEGSVQRNVVAVCILMVCYVVFLVYYLPRVFSLNRKSDLQKLSQ